MTHCLISVSPRKDSWESTCMINFSQAELNRSSYRNDSHYPDLHFILARIMAINHLRVTAIDNYGANGPQGVEFACNGQVKGEELTVIRVQNMNGYITEASKKILILLFMGKKQVICRLVNLQSHERIRALNLLILCFIQSRGLTPDLNPC